MAARAGGGAGRGGPEAPRPDAGPAAIGVRGSVARGSKRLCCVPPAGLLLRLCRLLAVLRLLPQDPTVPEHALHVRAVLHPRRAALLRHDVENRGYRDERARKSASFQPRPFPQAEEGVWEAFRAEDGALPPWCGLRSTRVL